MYSLLSDGVVGGDESRAPPDSFLHEHNTMVSLLLAALVARVDPLFVQAMCYANMS